ncbi:MAG: D-glycero-beta-D-manno-heptose 1-phosphate adenylyltransferase [Deltaproteobacteria bacterium]|nr:D-glycero-beta-D-manno-heptose 1-phosphate adenylyltransferase [Deltaproteobacteria bacterium]
MNNPKDKIFSLEELAPILQKSRDNNKKFVFTNGCFDIIHTGHTRYLFEARQAGDFLVVGVNSDRSISQIKGDKRPIIKLDERMEILASLYFVDFVFSFDEPDPCNALRKLKPDILIKGGDWSIDQVVGKEIVEAYGGKVFTVPEIKGNSTSSIVDIILQNHN